MKSVLWVVEVIGEDGEWEFYAVKQSRSQARRLANFARKLGEKTRVEPFDRRAA